MLDLGTGTGVILGSLSDIAPDLMGIDISSEMLDVAQRNVPQANFELADMSDFDLGRRVGFS